MSTLKYSQTNTKVNTINYSKGVLSSRFICIKPVLFHKHFSKQRLFICLTHSSGNISVIPTTLLWFKNQVTFHYQVTSHKSPFMFWKSSDDRTVWPFQLSMTADAAIRIGLHSAEVVHLCHNNCNSSSGVTGPDLSYAVRELPILTFHLHTLV